VLGGDELADDGGRSRRADIHTASTEMISSEAERNDELAEHLASSKHKSE